MAAVAAEEETARSKQNPIVIPDMDIPTELSSLLPNINEPIVRPETWRQVALTVLALLKVARWTTTLVYQATHICTSKDIGILSLIISSVAIASWVYSALRPSIRPSCTPYYNLFMLYLSFFLASLVILYKASTSNTGNIGFSWGQLAQVLDAFITFTGLAAIVNMPLATIGKLKVDEDVLPVLIFL